MGHGEKDRIASFERIDAVLLEDEIGMADERGVQIRHRRSGKRIGGDDAHFERRMLAQEPHELDAGESGRPNNARFYRHVCSSAHALNLRVSCHLSYGKYSSFCKETSELVREKS